MMIYCVEDDENIRELVLYALNNNGYKAIGLEAGESLFKLLKKELPDLILLDIMLPGEDGINILKALKADPSSTEIPVIMLTAKSSEYDKVKGLDYGADDYISKPFGVMELLSRIRAVLRRIKKDENNNDILNYKNLILNYSKHTVYVGDEFINLTFKEFELLYYLLKNKEIALTRDKIMVSVWGFDYEGESRTVDMHIKSLRQKLNDDGNIIKTIRGVGYKIGD
ncbi:MAG: two component transcriptional regulator, winged helix family [Clostridia bacterium]|nr:two component transcriptional regulator, winged helix family [Clostridia bacterium]